jgi:hypothetical protein
MQTFALNKLVFTLALASLATASHAADIVRFNFNSSPADTSGTTGTLAPAFGSGTASLVGGATGSFASGTANGGSSDPALIDNTGWQTTAYAAQGGGDKTRGVQFAVNTTGYTDIVFGYDLRHSGSSSKWERVQYTVNGSSFTDFALFSAATGDTWNNGRLVDFTGVAGVSNNANFGVRVLATFAPNTSAYAATQAGANYATTGTWRFDNVSVSGNAIAAVPEPEGVLLSLAGFAALAAVARRKAVA